MPASSSPGRRALVLFAAVTAGFALWFWDLNRHATSLGLFTFLSPPLIAAVWLTCSVRAEVLSDARALARVLVLLGAAGLVAAVVAGTHPAVGPTLAAAALQLAVLAPLLVGTRIAGGALRRRWGERRRGRLAATLIGEALPALVWLPVFMLAHEVHRAQGHVEPEELGIDWPRERIVFPGSGGTELVALWFAAPDPRGAVLLIHGIGADKAQFLLDAEILRQRGYAVLTYDQRNHGEASGLTSTLGIVEADDAVCAWTLLHERTRGLRIPRVVMGVSMGGAAAQLALPRLDGLDGLILDSTFADIRSVALRRLPLGPFGAPALAAARAFAVPLAGHPVLDVAPVRSAATAPPALPVLLLHARADPVVPFAESEALASAYGPRAMLVPLDGNGHARGLLDDGPRYRQEVVDFVERLARTGGGP